MSNRNDIKNEVKYMLLAFPNYRPNLEGEFNVLDVLLDLLGKYEANLLHQAVKLAIMETGRVFAPSASEIADRANELIRDEKNRYKPPKEKEVYLSGEELAARLAEFGKKGE